MKAILALDQGTTSSRALVFDRAFATLVDERFTGDLARSREVTLASVERRGFAERARLGLARLLSPLL